MHAVSEASRAGHAVVQPVDTHSGMWGSANPQRAAALATAERVAAEQAAQRMALLERPLGVDVDILHAFFDGASWAEAFDQFFATHCPRFAKFGDGSECSLELTAIHRQFINTAEALLDKQLGEMAVSADTFMSTLMSTVNDAPPHSTRLAVATNVLERLDECADFEKFGAMMRARHQATVSKPVMSDAAIETWPQQRSSEDEEFAREQQRIREASERRRRARIEAMQRAEETADELDAELQMEMIARQETCPHAELYAGMCTLCGEQVVSARKISAHHSVGSVSHRPKTDLEPEPEPERKPASSGSTDSIGKSNECCWDGWEVGSVCCGTVSFWNTNAGWGKIMRSDDATTGDVASASVDSGRPASMTTYKTTVTTTLPSHGKSTTVTRGGHSLVVEKEIYVHNIHLPDASRRWLQ